MQSFQLIPYLYSRLINVSIPRKTRQNGTLYVHSFVTPKGKKPFSGSWAVPSVEALTTYMIPQAETFQLIGSETTDDLKKVKYNFYDQTFQNDIDYNIIHIRDYIPLKQVHLIMHE
jgi:hypothetical protein